MRGERRKYIKKYRNAKNILLISLAAFFAFCASNENFAADSGVEKMSYVCRDMSGGKRWQANTEIKKEHGNIYTMVEKAQGFYSGFKGRISWVAKMEFEETKDNIRPIKLDKRVFDDRGNVIRVERQEFDLVRKMAVCTHIDPTKNINRTRRFTFDKDVVNRLSLGLYAQKFIASGRTEERVQMVSEEPNMYDVELSVLDKEVIDVNGCKKTAYKLSIDPQLGMLDMAKVFFPKAYAWHSASPDFSWLRYTGLEGGINSKKVEVTAR